MNIDCGRPYSLRTLSICFPGSLVPKTTRCYLCREREIVTSLISCPIMTQQRSLSGLPEDLCLPSSPPYASPLMESMVCAASLASRTCSSATSQSNPSIGFTFTPSIPLIGEKSGEAAPLTCTPAVCLGRPFNIMHAAPKTCLLQVNAAEMTPMIGYTAVMPCCSSGCWVCVSLYFY